MPVFKVKVKWGKKKFESVEVDTNESPEVFKIQLFSLSGVSPERQKVMIGGMTLLDTEWGKAEAKVKENATFLMMGSVGELPSAPKEGPKFIEDMSEAEAAAALLLPVGLENFGNTCYMNATLQCLKCVPELRLALNSHTPSNPQDSLTNALRSLYVMMDKSQARLPLLMFMETLHQVMPHFAERDEKTNSYKQQDAHECWSAIMSSLAQTLSSSTDSQEASNTLKFVEQYFGVRYKTTFKCIDSPEEQETTETEKALQISCFISQDVKYTYTGLQKGLEGTIEKLSPTLNVNANYKKVSRISRLPSYLTIQYIRFFVGKIRDGEEMVAKKILKDIKYQVKLDMYDFCTPELQEKLMPCRRRFKEVEDKKTALRAKAIAEGEVHGPKKQTLSQQEEEVEYESCHFPDDPGSSSSGYYELSAVLTHQGRSSSSGHYLGWVRHKGKEWLKLDDDTVTVVLEEDILKLSGGGDWHTAYILLYAAQQLEVVKEDSEATSETKSTAPEEMESSS